MTDITLKLDAEALREATAQAIMGALSPEVRAKMIESAIQAILKPSTNSWEKNKTPIEIAFEGAVIELARQSARDMVLNDQNLSNRIGALLRQTADKVLSADTEKLADRMADAFVTSLRSN